MKSNLILLALLALVSPLLTGCAGNCYNPGGGYGAVNISGGHHHQFPNISVAIGGGGYGYNGGGYGGGYGYGGYAPVYGYAPYPGCPPQVIGYAPVSR